MTDPWTNRWNERYSAPEFAYGEEPNDYLKEWLVKLKIGKILFPAEGEGRNAVYAAKLGWTVSAFDISVEGQKKAKRLAEKNNVTLNYQVGQLETLDYKDNEFDVIALIYAHFPASIKSQIDTRLNKYLREGGTIIFEAFSKRHVDYQARNGKAGGPRDIESLFSIDEIKNDFGNYDIIELKEIEISLHEGIYHSGPGSVIRFVGHKKTI
ncbi:MAG: SAM-dependent methyltransferase [Bacteroidetes bacterium]|nr:MAG: SAM-dependent methyltransferase [Bacteroidota bacterium]